MKIAIVIGARPNFIKIAPLAAEIKNYPRVTLTLVHTGQHYDLELSDVFFQDLGIPEPDYNLNIGSGSHAWQTARIMEALEPILTKEKPDCVIVPGDVNSSLAGALTAAKLGIPVAHIEAGPRTYDKTSPEEINRVVVDHVADLLFCPTKPAVKNLKKEGIEKGVYNTGDLMYDLFLQGMEIAKKTSTILPRLKVTPKTYSIATIHRAENTENRERLEGIMNALSEMENVIFPCHPRTKKYLKQYGLWDALAKKVTIIKPIGYIDMLWLVKNAIRVLTDSGGLQKETYWAGVPCLTLMDNTGWPETIEGGWNRVVGYQRNQILQAVETFHPRGRRPSYFGDGKAAKNIIDILLKEIS